MQVCPSWRGFSRVDRAPLSPGSSTPSHPQRAILCFPGPRVPFHVESSDKGTTPGATATQAAPWLRWLLSQIEKSTMKKIDRTHNPTTISTSPNCQVWSFGFECGSNWEIRFWLFMAFPSPFRLSNVLAGRTNQLEITRLVNLLYL